MKPPAHPPSEAEADARGSRPTRSGVASRAGHLGFVAHEVRNPLSTALWSAELLERLTPAERAGERGTKLTGLCVRAMARVQVLVEDHLLCERLDAGGYALRPEVLGLAELVQVALDRLRLAPAPVVEVAPTLTVRADRLLLERALTGLVAVAARGPRAVRLVATAADGQLQLLVEGDATTPLSDPEKGAASDPAGRALALPVARRVAEVLGARLTAEPAGYLLVFTDT